MFSGRDAHVLVGIRHVEAFGISNGSPCWGSLGIAGDIVGALVGGVWGAAGAGVLRLETRRQVISMEESHRRWPHNIIKIDGLAVRVRFVWVL